MIYKIVGAYKNRGNEKLYEINMQNEIARSLYGIDSVNLLLGNNGSGKTTIIKDFILALSKGNSLKSVDISMSDSKLGVVYFTPSPFHKKISHRAKVNFKFSDISGRGVKLWQESPEQVLKDVEEIFHAFGIKSSLIGESDLDLVGIVFDVFYEGFGKIKKYQDSYYPALNSRNDYNVEDLENLYFKYMRAEGDCLKYKKEVQQREYGLHGIHAETEEYAMLQSAKEKFSNAGTYMRAIERDIKEYLQNWIGAEFRRRSSMDFIVRDCVMHIPTLIAIAVNKNFSKESMLRLLLDVRERNQDVDQVGEYIYQWESSDLLKLNYDSGRLKLRFDLLGNAGGGEEDKNKKRQRQSLFDDDRFKAYAELGLINFGFESLSSGESAILKQCLSLLRAGRTLSDEVDDLLFIIDEGDMLLHLTWQRAYIEKICKVLASFADGRCVQLIVATHSPLLASDVVSSAITCLNDQEEKVQGFGAPMSSIFNYDFDAPPVGCIAEAQITRLAELEGSYTDTDRKIISIIDDKMIKEYLEDMSVAETNYDS